MLDPGVTVCMHVCAQVVYNVGLCICLFDITKLEDAYVFPGDGASHTKGGCLLFLGCHISWGLFFCSKRSSCHASWGGRGPGPQPNSARNLLQ